MQKKSPLKYSFKVINSYLNVTVLGHFSLSEAKIMYTDALEYLLANRLSKLFFDVVKVKGEITTMDRYYFGEFAAFESLKYMGKGLIGIAVSRRGYHVLLSSLERNERPAPHLRDFMDGILLPAGRWVMTYDYKCLNKKCGKSFVLEMAITSKLEGRRHVGAVCPHCHFRNVTKLIPRKVSIVYKGKGFFSTDKHDK